MIPDGLRCTPHLLAKLRERDIAPEEVAECLRRPDVIEPHMGRRRFVRGSLVVVVAHDGALITVLIRSRTAWDSTVARSRT